MLEDVLIVQNNKTGFPSFLILDSAISTCEVTRHDILYNNATGVVVTCLRGRHFSTPATLHGNKSNNTFCILGVIQLVKNKLQPDKHSRRKQYTLIWSPFDDTNIKICRTTGNTTIGPFSISRLISAVVQLLNS